MPTTVWRYGKRTVKHAMYDDIARRDRGGLSHCGTRPPLRREGRTWRGGQGDEVAVLAALPECRRCTHIMALRPDADQ
jgi:hypothetical protein